MPPAAAAQPAPRVETVATGLVIPWEIAFLPDGRALVTERPGRIRLLARGGRLRRGTVAHVKVSAVGEGGLLGLAIDPAFARNRFVYLYFTTDDGMRLERRRWTRGRLVFRASLLDGIRAGTIHDSGRIAFGPDRRLYVSTGDAGEPALAQDPASLNGKLLALTPGQYRGPGPAAPEIVASGLRNAQGFDWEPGTGRLIATDHGPSGFDGPEGFDEVDEIVPGGNYGWPLAIGYDTGGGLFSPPLRVWKEAIAPSGATFVTRRLPVRVPARDDVAEAVVPRREGGPRPAAAGRDLRPPADGRRGSWRPAVPAHEQPRPPRLPHQGRRPHPASAAASLSAEPESRLNGQCA